MLTIKHVGKGLFMVLKNGLPMAPIRLDKGSLPFNVVVAYE